MFQPTRPSSGLQSSKRLVWQMLRSYHLAYKLYMRHKLRLSRYGGGRALMCGILGRGHLPWALLLLVLGGGTGWQISRPEHVTSTGEIKLYVRGKSRCV